MESLNDILLYVQSHLTPREFYKLISVNKNLKRILSLGNLPYKDRMFYEMSGAIVRTCLYTEKSTSKLVLKSNRTRIFVARDSNLKLVPLLDENCIAYELSTEISRAGEHLVVKNQFPLFNPENGAMKLRVYNHKYNVGNHPGEGEMISIYNITIQYPFRA